MIIPSFKNMSGISHVDFLVRDRTYPIYSSNFFSSAHFIYFLLTKIRSIF